MVTMTVQNARKSLSRLIENAQESHAPVHIVGAKANAVLISEEDWSAIEETLHLQSIPGMAEKLARGKSASLSECSKELEW